MLTTRSFLDATLKTPRLPGPTIDLLLTAVESGCEYADEVAAELWERSEHKGLSEPALERLLQPRCIVRIFALKPDVLISLAVEKHAARTEVLRLALAWLKENCPPKELTYNRKAEGKVASLLNAALKEPQDLELVSELAQWYPPALGHTIITQRREAASILLRILEDLGESLSTAHVSEFLKILALMSSGNEEGEKLLETMYRKVLAARSAPKVLTSNPSFITNRVMKYGPKKKGIVEQVVRSTLAEERPYAAPLLAIRDQAVADEVLKCFSWKDLEKITHKIEDLTALQARVVEVAGRELLGNKPAQEVFWGLANEWEGTVGALLETALATSGS